MTSLHIAFMLLLLPLAGCASQLQPRAPAQSVEEKTQAQQSQKQTMPTFTYRPGA